MTKKKVVKRKLKLRGVLFLILIGYLLIQGGYYLYNLPVSSYVIKDNTTLSDSEIYEIGDFVNKDNFYIISSNKIKSSLEDNEFIKEVSVTKDYINRTITVNVVENKLLFYYSYNDVYVLENGSEVKDSIDLVVPTVINYVPNTILDEFIDAFSVVDQELILKISEIEYSPTISNDVLLDEQRFILKMNDGNTVHVNIDNMDKFLSYDKIMEIESTKGTLYLDSSSEGSVFEFYGD